MDDPKKQALISELANPKPQPELRAYNPSLRDHIATLLMGDGRASPEWGRVVEGLIGSRGLGSTGMGLVDLTPAGAPLWTQEYKRAETPTDAAWAAANFIPGAKGVAQGVKAVADDAAKGFTLYHGSPHNWKAERLVRHADGREEHIVGAAGVLPDVPEGATVLKDHPHGRARIDKMGSGEGAQAYGKGFYGAEAEATGKAYRDALAGLQDTPAPPHIIAEYEARLAPHMARHEELTQRILEMPEGPERDALKVEWEANIQQLNAMDDEHMATLTAWHEANPPSNPEGHMYELRVNADPAHFAEWDKPIGKQPDNAGAAIQRLVSLAGDETDESSKLAAQMFDMTPPPPMPWDWHTDTLGDLMQMTREHSPEKILQEAGVPGIKYLDQGSRGAGDGSRNYVLFREDIIEVVRKYGIAAAISTYGANAVRNAMGEAPEGENY